MENYKSLPSGDALQTKENIEYFTLHITTAIRSYITPTQRVMRVLEMFDTASQHTGGYIRLKEDYHFLPVLIGNDNTPIPLYELIEGIDEIIDYDRLRELYPTLSYSQISGAIEFLRKIVQFNITERDIDDVIDDAIIESPYFLSELRESPPTQETSRVKEDNLAYLTLEEVKELIEQLLKWIKKNTDLKVGQIINKEVDKVTLVTINGLMEVKIMERSIYNALAKLGTIEILKSDSEVKERFNSLIHHIRTGSDEMSGLLDNVVEDSQSVVVEVLEAKDDIEFILRYFIETGMDLWEELYNEEQTLGESRSIDSMARRIIRKAKDKGILED